MEKVTKKLSCGLWYWLDMLWNQKVASIKVLEDLDELEEILSNGVVIIT